MRFSCPSCNKMYRLPPERMAGYQRAQISCPNCKANIIVRNMGGDVLDARLATREVSGPVLLTDVRAVSQMSAPVEASWFVAIGRDRQGPMTPMRLSELLSVGTINAQSLVWQKGMANWVPMADVNELRGLLRPQSGVQAIAPALSPTATGPAPSVADVRSTAPAPAAATVAPSAPSVTATVPAAVPSVTATVPAAAPSVAVAVAPAPSAPAPHRTGPSDSDIQRVAQAETHTDSFFTASHDLDHVALAMPNPDKHKPTKEEYQNLIQEFSVMFRLDKRSKRQKILIAVVVSSLVIGTIAFGLIMRYQGNKKAQLLTDANNILGMFSLQYQTSVTIDLGQEAAEAEAKAGEPKKAGKADESKKEVQLSDLAVKMRAVVKAKAKKAPVAHNANTTAPSVSKEEQDRLMKLLDGGGSAAGGKALAEDVSAGEVKKNCAQWAPSLRTCGQNAGAADFKISFSITTGGKVDGVKAVVGGKPDASLASCCEKVLKKKSFGAQSKESSHSCVVD